MIQHWLTFGMSSFETSGLQDTSRLMTLAYPGSAAYIEPLQSMRNIRNPGTTLLDWQTRSEAGTCTIYKPPLSIPRKLDVLQLGPKLQCAYLKRKLSDQWGRNWRKSTVVYVTNWSPNAAIFIEQLHPEYLLFDCVDDVLSFPYGWDRVTTLQSWRTLANLSSAIIAVSPVLRDLMERDLGTTVHVVANGVNAEHFLTSSAIPLQDLERASQTIKTIKIGFAGTLNHWIDFKSLLNLVNEREDVFLYLMGRTGYIENEEQQTAFAKLMGHNRVRMVGEVDYRQLPGYLQSMDILILPRIESPASASSSPLKMFEYLAVGKPCVFGGVPIPDDVKPLVYEVREGHYAEAIGHAMEEVRGDKPSLKQPRQEYALKHTWEQRIDKVIRLIHS